MYPLNPKPRYDEKRQAEQMSVQALGLGLRGPRSHNFLEKPLLHDPKTWTLRSQLFPQIQSEMEILKKLDHPNARSSRSAEFRVGEVGGVGFRVQDYLESLVTHNNGLL